MKLKGSEFVDLLDNYLSFDLLKLKTQLVKLNKQYDNIKKGSITLDELIPNEEELLNDYIMAAQIAICWKESSFESKINGYPLIPYICNISFFA